MTNQFMANLQCLHRNTASKIRVLTSVRTDTDPKLKAKVLDLSISKVVNFTRGLLRRSIWISSKLD